MACWKHGWTQPPTFEMEMGFELEMPRQHSTNPGQTLAWRHHLNQPAMPAPQWQWHSDWNAASKSPLARRKTQIDVLLSQKMQPEHSCPGHRARNSDSTSIYYYEIRELKKTFKFNSGNPNYLPEVSFKWKKNGPKLVNFTPDRIKQIDKRIVWGEISTWSKDWNCKQKLKAVQQKFNG